MTTVIVPAYRIPEKRVRDFVYHNSVLFEEFEYNCLLITNEWYEPLPVWCKNIIYPGSGFHIAKFKNFGIRAVASGIVIATDIDVKFTREFCEAVSKISLNEAIIPCYYSVRNWKDEDKSVRWQACGTCATNYYNWNLVRGYDERMTSYGAEDGNLVDRLELAKVHLNYKQIPIYHVSHDAQHVDWPSRTDQWNRDINPPNPANYELSKESHRNQDLLWENQKESKSWGLA
jgi:hypothetical protein